jgi:hypothetical protein
MNMATIRGLRMAAESLGYNSSPGPNGEPAAREGRDYGEQGPMPDGCPDCGASRPQDHAHFCGRCCEELERVEGSGR